MTLKHTLAEERLVVFLGTGGVGKTTLAASAAIGAARAGRRVALVTIDPARRLADALGLDALHDAPTRVPLEDGVLDALVLVPERTFDQLVTRYAGSEAVQRRILDNSMYRHLSRSLAGSAEYAAMERVHELLSTADYDLVVVDTPPSQHALDFLEAPQRLLWLFDSSVLRHLLHPAFVAGRLGLQWFGRASARVFQLVERITGVGFLEELSEFLLAFEGISGSLQHHAREVQDSLADAAFVVVASPDPPSAQNAERFWDRLRGAKTAPAGLVWNRVHPIAAPPPAIPADRAFEAALRAHAGDETARAPVWARTATEAARRYLVRADAETHATAALSDRARQEGGFVQRVPEDPRPVHDLPGLERLAASLADPAGATSPRRSDA